MYNEFDKRLDFDSETFRDMKQDMNFILQRLLENMNEKGTDEGSMTLKIDVTLIKEFIPNYDPYIKGESREIRKPQFKHKVTSSVKINDEKSGSFDNEMEMVMDEETGMLKLVPIANTQQRTIFDSDFMKENQEVESEKRDESDGPKAIEGRETPLLPAPNETVIDGEFREVDSEEKVTDDGVRKCITGWSKYGVCSCCGNNGVKCCNECEEHCNSRCGWIDEPYVPEVGAVLEDITDELLGDEPEDDGYSYDEPEGE